MKSKAPLKLRKKLALRNPRLIVVWGCIGEVGLLVANYLKDKLGAEEFGQIEPYDFFDAPITIKDGVVENLEFPQTKLYGWENEEGNGLVICIADSEPTHARYEYASLILDLAQQLEINKLYTVCAFPAPIHHSEQPKVIGVVNDAKVKRYLKQRHVPLMEDRDLTSMNALIMGLARRRKIQGIYLLGEVPAYASEMANPKSAKAVKVERASTWIDADTYAMSHDHVVNVAPKEVI